MCEKCNENFLIKEHPENEWLACWRGPKWYYAMLVYSPVKAEQYGRPYILSWHFANEGGLREYASLEELYADRKWARKRLVQKPVQVLLEI